MLAGHGQLQLRGLRHGVGVPAADLIRDLSAMSHVGGIRFWTKGRLKPRGVPFGDHPWV